MPPGGSTLLNRKSTGFKTEWKKLVLKKKNDQLLLLRWNKKSSHHRSDVSVEKRSTCWWGVKLCPAVRCCHTCQRSAGQTGGVQGVRRGRRYGGKLGGGGVVAVSCDQLQWRWLTSRGPHSSWSSGVWRWRRGGGVGLMWIQTSTLMVQRVVVKPGNTLKTGNLL